MNQSEPDLQHLVTIDSPESVMYVIPHRPPFLFVDRVIAETEDSVTTELVIRGEQDFFKGHYPNNPIMPGVLLCESVFQSAALLIAKLANIDPVTNTKVPVLARILDAKFKHMVRPGDVLSIEVKFVGKMSVFYKMAGTIRNQDQKIVLTLECMLAIVDESKANP